MTTSATKLSAKSHAKKMPLVPRLRFPEFEEAWKLMKLNKLAAVNPRRTSLGDDVEITFVPMASVSDSGHLMTPETRVYKDVKKGFTYFIENDILIAKITPCFENGKRFLAQNLMNEHGVGSTEFHVIRPNQNSNNRFIFYYLSLEHVNSRGRDFMSGSGGQQRVPADFYIQLGTPVPTLPEQQKIADCLSSLDDLIAVESEKLETLKVHKKGLMQELFPREGETTPRIRFPEFEKSGEWEVKRLEKICRPRQWPTVSSSDLLEAGYPVFGANGFIGFYSEYNHAKETIAVTCRGATCGNVSLVPGGSYITGNAMCLDEVNEDITSVVFLYNALKFRGFDDVISGSAQPQIIGRAISKVAVAYPSLSEQQKIASALSSLDDRITAQAERIETLKAHKKGLMQQLFPVMEA